MVSFAILLLLFDAISFQKNGQCIDAEFGYTVVSPFDDPNREYCMNDQHIVEFYDDNFAPVESPIRLPILLKYIICMFNIYIKFSVLGFMDMIIISSINIIVRNHKILTKCVRIALIIIMLVYGLNELSNLCVENAY